jgi:hypothetical protein
MAREYKEGVDFVWVSAKDKNGKIIKDGKGNPTKTRDFNFKSAPAAAPAKPKAKARPAAPATPAAPRRITAQNAPIMPRVPAARGPAGSPTAPAPKVTGVSKSGRVTPYAPQSTTTGPRFVPTGTSKSGGRRPS